MRTACAHFGAALPQALDEIDRALFKLAERAASNAQQQTLFESLGELRRKRTDLVPRFLQHAESTLARLRSGAPPQAPAPLPTPALELVDPSVLEEDLALREIAGKSEIRNSQALYAIAHRLGVLGATPALPYEVLPLGPARLVEAFRHALGDLDFGVERRVHACRIFDRTAMATLGRFYETINAQLAARGILPHLHWSATRPRPAASTPSAEMPPPTQPPSAGTPAPEPAHADDAGLFDTLYRLLATRRRRGDGPAQAATPSATPASRDDLQSLLGALQREQSAPFEARGDEPPHDTAQFKRELFDRLRKAGPHGSALRLVDDDVDTIELVGLLFEYIGANLRANSGARALLNRLHVPVLRVALGDRSFFTRRSHPARELLNTIAETGERWIDESDSDPDLSAKMRLVVDSVSADYDGDLTLFENLLSDLGRHMQLLARRAEVFERRQVDAARGREKLEVARATARGAIAQALRDGSPTDAVRNLLDQAWTDALALSALRHGSSSAEFRRRLAVASALVRSGGPAALDAAIRQELEAGLGEVGVHADDTARLIAGLDRAIEGAAGTPPQPQPADDTAPVKARFGEQIAPVEAAVKPQPIPLNAVETATLERLREVPFGTWFVFTLNQQGASVRRKLAWFSTVTRRCLFVNQRGARCDDRTLDQLARDIVRGQVRIEVPPQSSLIDRAWKAIVEALSQQEAS
ncbi:DUF1631 family protein [Dokdonella ginsengisoli]|uniref:DUF1631 family protein n=1 Tax=Dokdonella ginsengisoli TaxID=363846 RepID=A0ABV9QYY1_9GAMM